MIDPRVASGVRDLTPAMMIPRERMLGAFRDVFAGFGFQPIETPHIERMEVLTGMVFGSDEVLRQIFEVTNKGTPGELALRFDLTVPLALFVAKHIDELGVPVQTLCDRLGFSRRADLAKGRFREFVQCDFDTIGTESPIADADECCRSSTTHSHQPASPSFTITLNNRKVLDGFLESLELSGRSGPVLRAIDKLAKIGRDAVTLERAGRRTGGVDHRQPGRAGPRFHRIRPRRSRDPHGGTHSPATKLPPGG